MSTRSIIARVTGDGFTGIYCHFDGYPSGVGEALWSAYQGHFEQDAEALLHFFIDEHSAGWSCIGGKDISLKPGYVDLKREREHSSKNYEKFRKSKYGRRAQCYCHGDRDDTDSMIFNESSETWCEWAYVINAHTNTMFIHKQNGKCENPIWDIVHIVNLRGDEPDWKAIEEKSRLKEFLER